MLSFKSIAVFATLAFGALSAMAVPVLDNNNVGVAAIVAKCDCKSLPTIIADLKVDLTVSVNEFTYLTPSNCTVETITPLVLDVKAKISAAIVEIQALVGLSADVVLASVDGTVIVTVDVLAQLVGDLLIFIFASLNICLTVCASVSLSAVVALLCSLGEVLAAFVSVILSVTAHLFVGLDVAILGCIGSILSIIVHLNISLFLAILPIKL